MIIRYTGVITVLLFLISCSSEKVSLSPVYNIGTPASTDISKLPSHLKDKSQELFYASELSNQVASFPKFQNDAMNKEVNELKYNIKDYVYAIQEYNLVGRDKALSKIEKSYKKIQKLRTYLNQDDNETINRYLVRIKRNITQLEIALNTQNNTNP